MWVWVLVWVGRCGCVFGCKCGYAQVGGCEWIGCCGCGWVDKYVRHGEDVCEYV